jgi:hypothetical protein
MVVFIVYRLFVSSSLVFVLLDEPCRMGASSPLVGLRHCLMRTILMPV